MFDRYVDNRGTGSFILIDPSSNFTSGAGMIAESLRDRSGEAITRPTAAERLARVARGAATEAEAVEAVRKALEELLT
jgi:sulfate adenylyltransferase subunit 1 (EFTu-like GTPase family)